MKLNQAILMTAILALVSLPAAAVEPMSDKALREKSKAAKTVEDHTFLAEQFLLRADHYTAKAEKHEAEVKEIASRKVHNPMTSKWPAMAEAPATYAKNQALQARRAAEEARKLAAFHQDEARKLQTAARTAE